MKKKRIVLHVVALILALACMVCVELATLKWINVTDYYTKEEAQEQYCNLYVGDVEALLSSLYDSLRTRDKKTGNYVTIDDIGLPEDLVASGFYYTLKKEETNQVILTNYFDSDEMKTNVVTFGVKGLRFDLDQGYDSFVMDRMFSYIDTGTFFYDKKGIDVAFEKLQKLCEKNKFYIVMHTEEEGDDDTAYAELRRNINYYSVTEKQRNAWKKEAIVYAIMAIVFALLALVPYLWLLVIAGHKEKGDKSQLQKVDKLWMDVVLVATVSIYSIAILLTGDELYDGAGVDDAIVFGVWIFITMFAVEVALQISESIVRRLKTKSFIRTTLIGKICISVKRAVIKMVRNMKLSAKVIVICIGVELILLADYACIATVAEGIFGAMCIVAIPVVVIGVFVWNYFKEKEIIIEETEIIAAGQVDHKIYDPMKFPSNKKLVNAVNGIGEGLSKAVSSSVKNERMKTELITNVSHDLKTPLTSIINYVDLLKKDGLDSDKALEYLDVLDRKSQRLKTLTEDLVEASKINSGVIELHVEDIDIVQLVNQSLAEYSERFEQSGLHIIKNITRDTIIVKADGRKTWRALDNLYSNVCKYAMPGTRVYIDIMEESDNAVVSIKNISAGALNFSADELMERFVRGDVSRTTEGSGLGLSIAKGIMERQNGELQITLDGDLFKVNLKLKKD